MLLKRCKRCMTNKTENDGHILSTCPSNKALISKRHDFIVNKIAKELVKVHSQAKVFRERVWRSATELLRPDITLIQDNECKIIEVTAI